MKKKNDLTKAIWKVCISLFAFSIVSCISNVHNQAQATSKESVTWNVNRIATNAELDSSVVMGSRVASDGENLYYVNDSKEVIKKSLAVPEKEEILIKSEERKFIGTIAVYDGWVYYDIDTTLIRTSTDGKKTEELITLERDINDICIIDGKIYLAQMWKNVMQLDLDGSNPKVLLEASVMNLCYSEKMLYITCTDGYKDVAVGMWSYHVGNGILTKISEECVTPIVVHDGKMYYSEWSEQANKRTVLYKEIGTQEEKIINKKYDYCFTFYKNQMIISSEKNIYILSEDLTQCAFLAKGSAVAVIGDIMYYIDYQDSENSLKSVRLTENRAYTDSGIMKEYESNEINQMEFELKESTVENVYSVGPYEVKMSKDCNSFSLISAYTNGYEAICPEILTLPATLKVGEKTYPVTAIEDGFSVLRKVEEVIVPEGIVTIGAYFCSDSSEIMRLSLPASVKKIGVPLMDTDFGQDNLITIEINPDNRNYRVIDGALYTKNGKTLVRAFAEGEFKIPEGVTTLEEACFHGNKQLEKVIVPEGVTTIKEGAFRICTKLEEVILPDSVSLFGFSLFESCVNLKKVNIPKSLTTIPAYCFSFTAIEEMIIPEGVKTIDECAFYSCSNIKKLSFPSTLKKISRNAVALSGEFYGDPVSELKPSNVTMSSKNPYYKIVNGALLNKEGTKLYFVIAADKNYTIPASVKTIKSYAFAGQKQVKKVTLTKNITTISDYMFANSSVENVVCTSSLTKIGVSAFRDSNLSKINLPNSLVTIEEAAFYECGLKEITIPAKVKYIGKLALGQEGGRIQVTFKGTKPPTIELQTYDPEDEGSVMELFVPSKSKKKYIEEFKKCNSKVTYTIKGIS